MIMTVLLAVQTSRASIIDLAGAERGSLHPASLLTAFVANLYGTDGPLADFWGQPSFAWGPTDLFLARNMSDAYMGAIPLIALFVLGVARGALAAREVRFFVIALLMMTIYALGRYTPVFAVMFHLPGVGLFRRPADATFLMGALAAILAGYSVHRLIIGDLQARRTGTILGRDPHARRTRDPVSVLRGGKAASARRSRRSPSRRPLQPPQGPRFGQPHALAMRSRSSSPRSLRAFSRSTSR